MSASAGWLNLPNRITLARLVIAVVLFALLSVEIHTGALGRSLALNLAFGIFILCVTTDWLDGYLARRLGLVTAFGRIADPFVDKIVVCGAFIYLVELSDIIHAWYAVVVLAREFLVSGLRSYLESRGVPFGARGAGKMKMVLQSVAIPAVLFYEANFAGDSAGVARFFFYLAWGTALAALAATVLSAFEYAVVAARALAPGSDPGSSEGGEDPT